MSTLFFWQVFGDVFFFRGHLLKNRVGKGQKPQIIGALWVYMFVVHFHLHLFTLLSWALVFIQLDFGSLKRLATGSPRVPLVGLGKTSFVASNTQQSTHLMSQRSHFPKTLLPKKIFMRCRIVFFRQLVLGMFCVYKNEIERPWGIECFCPGMQEY